MKTGRPLLSLLLAALLFPSPLQASSTQEQELHQVAQELELLRGWSFTEAVPVRSLSPQALRDHLADSLDKDPGPEEMLRLQAHARLVGLIPADTELRATLLALLEEQVAGFYDPEDDALFLIQSYDELGSLFRRYLMAHELTHALDDQNLDLGAFLDPAPQATWTEDQSLVRSAIAEGSATLLSSLWMTRALKRSSPDQKEALALLGRQLQQLKGLRDIPPYFKTVLAAYVLGPAFLSAAPPDPDADPRTGASIRSTLEDPPQSSEQLLHPERYWQLRDSPWLPSNPEALIAALPGPLLGTDTLGELLCALLTRSPRWGKNPLALARPKGWTNRAATGWGGDQTFLFGSDLTHASLLWVTHWDSERDRRQFVRALKLHRRPGRQLRIATAGKTALFLFGKADLDLAPLLTTIQTQETD